MALTQKFLKHITLFIRKGFTQLANEKNITPYMAATSYNKLHAIVGEYPELELDPKLVKVSIGALPGVEAPTVGTDKGGLLIQWKDNQDAIGADKTDRLILLAYDPEYPSKQLILGGAYRYHKKEFLNMENFPSGKYELYAAFMTLEGDKTSDSIHLGAINWEEEN